MAAKKQDDKKVKFIRKGGKVIPIKSGGKKKGITNKKGKKLTKENTVVRAGGRVRVEKKADKRIIKSAKKGRTTGARFGAAIGGLGVAGILAHGDLMRRGKLTGIDLLVSGTFALGGAVFGSAVGGRMGERKGMRKGLRKEIKKGNVVARRFSDTGF